MRLAELVAAKTGGKVKVDLFHNAALGSEREAAEGVKSGSIDMAYSGLTGFGSYVPEFGVLEMPFLYDTLDQVKSVVDKISPRLEARMASVGPGAARVPLRRSARHALDARAELHRRLQGPEASRAADPAVRADGAGLRRHADAGGPAGGVHGAPVEDRRGARGDADLALRAEVPRGGEEPRADRPHLLRRLHRHERGAAREAVARTSRRRSAPPAARPAPTTWRSPSRRSRRTSPAWPPAASRSPRRTGRRSAPRSARCASGMRPGWASEARRSTARSRP